ncbi:DUF4160 domain-containing protein [uncultured Thiodictyon sp.]|uniref:DUF4160 domain-containing protein n=1 Tax=uncultured Thiodictyon sp. TaxID=1846217 RepID=UPI0025CCF48B|nr:DUF4160 domain-containing protein [uncultured Thiodictyon sp.]
MPTIARFPNCRVEVRALDHPPPHFHVVMSDGRDNLVEIDTLAMLGPIRAREIAQVLAWAIEHRPDLIAEWRKYHP